MASRSEKIVTAAAGGIKHQRQRKAVAAEKRQQLIGNWQRSVSAAKRHQRAMAALGVMAAVWHQRRGAGGSGSLAASKA
jgi:hypothetical protein